MNPERVYSEAEIAKIIERAMRHQDSEQDCASKKGLTLDELERMGRDVGLAPEHLRRAAAEVCAMGVTSQAEAQVNADQVQAVRWIPGSFSEEDIENAFAEIKNVVGPDTYAWWRPADTVTRLGSTYEWSDSTRRITVRDDGEGCAVHVTSSQFFNGRATEAVVVSLLASVAIGGIPAGAVGEVYGVLWAVLILTVALVLSFALVPGYIKRHRARTEREVSSLADQIVEIIPPRETTLGTERPASESLALLQNEMVSSSENKDERSAGRTKERTR